MTTKASGAEAVAGNLADTSSLAQAFEGVTAAHLISFAGEDFSPLTNGVEIAELARKLKKPTPRDIETVRLELERLAQG